MKNNKGFTLIELMVVMIIIGILVLLATPRFLNYIKDARVTALQTDVKVLRDGSMLYGINKDANAVNEVEYPVKDGNVTLDSKVKKAIKLSVENITGETDVDVSELELKILDADLLKDHIRNTSNDIEEYVIATDGKAKGEVFYITRVLDNSMDEGFVTLESFGEMDKLTE